MVPIFRTARMAEAFCLRQAERERDMLPEDAVAAMVGFMVVQRPTTRRSGFATSCVNLLGASYARQDRLWRLERSKRRAPVRERPPLPIQRRRRVVDAGDAAADAGQMPEQILDHQCVDP